MVTFEDLDELIANPMIFMGFFFYSGGIVIGVIGKHLDRVQSPRMIIWYMNTPYENVSAFFYSVFIFRLNEDSL